MPNAVLVIDMLKGFCQEGYPLYCGETVSSIIPNVAGLLQEETEKGSRVFFIADSHKPDDLEFKMFPPHCISGSPESEIIDELGGYRGERIDKQRYSAFYNTSLDEKLREHKPEKLIVCGVCTDICVMHTVADARNRDYQVEVPVECVTSFDPEAHRWALEHMEKILGAHLTGRKQE
ncbi:MAG: cysteine hydrolase [Dehalococcoidaceae bacterium]|nr:cysteine hydrolase [Dehalococcoidaceae bacterium]